MPQVEYREIPPPQELRHLIEACWHYRPDFSGPKRDILVPEGVIDVIFNFGAPYHRCAADMSADQAQWVHKDVIAGQRSKLFEVRWPRNTKLFAIRLNIVNAASLLGVSMNTITDQVIPLDSTPLAKLPLALRELQFDDFRALTNISYAFFSSLSEQLSAPPALLEQCIRRINNARGDLEIQPLCDELGIHRKTLERLFKHHVGLTPKQYLRTIRLHYFLQLHHKTHEPGLIGPVLDAQYYDQSHCIKEFKRFTGQSPGRFFREPPDIYEPLLASILNRHK